MTCGEDAPAWTTFAAAPVTITVRHAGRSKQEHQNTRGDDAHSGSPPASKPALAKGAVNGFDNLVRIGRGG